MTSAQELLAGAAAVLLDFDGPVTPLMPAPLNRQVADAARAELRSAGIELTIEIERSSDHLAVLRYAWAHHREHLDRVHSACVDGEVQAARSSVPTPGAHDFLVACRAARLPVVIVSNNSSEAVAAYLDRHSLGRLVDAVLGRPPSRPDLMKPDSHLLVAASTALGIPVSDTVMVGDSLSDVAAAHSVSAKIIGYGKTPRRALELAEVGADLVLDSMRDLVPVRSDERR